MTGLFIDLATIASGSSRLELEVAAHDLGLPEPGWPGQVRGTFEVEKNGDKVSVRGRVVAVAHLECARCLKGYDAPFEGEVVLIAERSGTANRREQAELERDQYMLFHDGRKLDLGGEAREALLLEVPITPHCREDCKGLCSRCGADLNDGPCGCPQ